MPIRRSCLILLAIYCFFLPLQSFAETAITWEEMRIPLDEDEDEDEANSLEALMVWPDDGLKHPVLLISHGTPRDYSQRTKMTALSYLPIATQFSRRGFTVVVVLRRGYGTSAGGFPEGAKFCKEVNYDKVAFNSSQDLRTTINYLDSMSECDTHNVVAVGVSAGGLATIALSAIDPPEGLRAAISFAGGRGSVSNNVMCQEEALVSTFSKLGKTSHIPTLWVYAKNDNFFNPRLAHRFLTAFTNAGGQAQFVAAAPYGEEGHYLFSAEGMPIWFPIVDEFLKSNHLMPNQTLLPEPESQLEIPDSLSASGKEAFKKYIVTAPHKAFALAGNGAQGWSSGQPTIEAAKKMALDYCGKYASDCQIIAVDDENVDDDSDDSADE